MLGIRAPRGGPRAARQTDVAPRRAILLIVFSCGTVLSHLAASAAANDLATARWQFNTGDYAACSAACDKAIKSSAWDPTWWELKLHCQLARGHYADALTTYEASLREHPSSIRLRLIGHEALRRNGRGEEAAQALAEIERRAEQSPWRYTDAPSRVALAQALLLQGADARQVLEFFLDKALRERPDCLEAHLAVGELGLAKHDYALAVESFERALQLDDQDPRVHFGLARAYEATDAGKAAVALANGLEINPRHVDSLLLQAENQIDGEHYTQAGKTLDWIFAVNPREARAWSHRAVLAHLVGDTKGEQLFRCVALGPWWCDPNIDHLIGKKLSQKYRFAEGAEYQRAALKLDPNYLPAKTQLCQDLLRLGDESGWKLAQEVYEGDGYNVVAFNLVTLRDNLAKFRTIEEKDFIVRMDAREAEIYGSRVLRLLHRAKETLCQKYDVTLDDPIVVEIFPEQKDFAIRTFGLPGGAGFLGVCFGKVITANSPASQGKNPSNWEAVLWHEFCHVVTLTKTRNKMPRWLSEGISVYEEKQADSRWGQTMNPRYREMILGGELTPVSELSGAFLRPKSALHVQFAYYESSLVVEYLIQRHGPRALQNVLIDLGQGVPINQALSRHTGSLGQFEEDFARYAESLAKNLAPGVDWSQPELPVDAAGDDLAKWCEENPTNLPGLVRHAQLLMDAERWEAAKAPLKKLIELYPGNIGGDNPYVLLALVHRRLNETDEEAAVLEQFAALDADAVDAGLRLFELAAARQDWEAVLNNARRVLAVNPLIELPHVQLAKAAEQLGDYAEAADAWRSLLAMDPIDPAEAHFRLAKLLYQTGDKASARRHVLMALEEAPRYRAAQQLLLAIVRDNAGDVTASRAEEEQTEEKTEEKKIAADDADGRR